jgi:CheY-like chemotaxis protein
MSSARILIVEDERIIAAELKKRLMRWGHAVVAVAGCGAEAIEKARELRPDLVLVDIGLPGAMTGLEAAAQIWEEHKTPVVYVTAHADEQTLAHAGTPPPSSGRQYTARHPSVVEDSLRGPWGASAGASLTAGAQGALGSSPWWLRGHAV